MQITVVARFKAKKGMEDALKKELMGLLGPGRADEGCIGYNLHQAVDDPTLFLFYENWQSRELLEKHSVRPHLVAFRERAKELLAEPSELTLLQML